jgi:hypothetical protein
MACIGFAFEALSCVACDGAMIFWVIELCCKTKCKCVNFRDGVTIHLSSLDNESMIFVIFTYGKRRRRRRRRYLALIKGGKPPIKVLLYAV